MNEMIRLFRGALTLDGHVFSDLKASPEVFRTGFMFVLVIGLVVGLVAGVIGTAQGILTDPAKAVQNARDASAQAMRSMLPSGAADVALQDYEVGFRIAERMVTETKAPLPHPVQVVFQQAGAIVSQPFGWLASLLFFGVLVHMSAKALGGSGSIAQMLGVSSLTVAPHILDAVAMPLALAPTVGGCASSLLGLAASVWGLIIYVKGTAVAHAMSNGRAVVAVLLPPIVLTVLTGLAFLLLVVVIAVANAQ